MPDNELLDIVDENDNVIGQETKQNKFEKELISRNVGIFVKDSNGKYIIVKRAPAKKSFPNRLDLAACGNVKAGENYQQAAEREIKEELGFSCGARFLKKIFNEHNENSKKVKYFTALFLGTCDENVRLNEELTHFEKMKLKELKEKTKKEPELFCPFFLKDFQAVKNILD